jgi:hypothetical protein
MNGKILRLSKTQQLLNLNLNKQIPRFVPKGKNQPFYFIKTPFFSSSDISANIGLRGIIKERPIRISQQKYLFNCPTINVDHGSCTD